ncbi:MAG TPA: hypothetical protein VFJ85_01160 [Acidimicrobiales bacterium]|nr:hypothetical protein [Acidimicrobiales bacterium]
MGGEVIKVAGRRVAQIELRSHYGDDEQQLTLFRAPDGWTVLTVRRIERYDDEGTLRSAEAVVSAAELPDLAALEEFFEYRDGWRELLDAGHGEDPELYAAWVPQEADRELDHSSIYNKDLAQATGYLGGQPTPAPGRALPGWETEACAAMAAHLDERGWQVRGPLRAVPGLGAEPGDNVVLGVLEAWRYGWAIAVVVRVDYCGEVYARRAGDDDVEVARALRQLSDAEEDEASAEYARRRNAD